MNGSTKSSIIKNSTSGLSIVTINAEDVSKFRNMAKQYKLPYFLVKDKKGYDSEIDICVDSKDVAGLRRILERCKIAAIDEVNVSEISQEVKEEIDKMRNKDFGTLSEEYKEKVETFSESVNRHTDKDFSRDEPYYVADRQNPTNFIKLVSEKAVDPEGKDYTKTTYSVHKDGEFIKDFTDERFVGRSESYWADLKKDMRAAGGFNDDMIYFRNHEVFSAYMRVYKDGELKEAKEETLTAHEVDKSLEDIVKKYEIKEAEKGEELNPRKAECSGKPLENLSKDGAKQKEGVKAWVDNKAAELKGSSSLKKATKTIPSKKGKTPKVKR